jgi:hypothetical protein
LQTGVQTAGLPAQLVVPFCGVHAWLQLPQLVTVLSVVSQPLPAMPSQSSVPGLHVVATQLPLAHDSLELGKSQAVPQVAQLVRVVSDVSQPLFALVSQLPNSASQPNVQPVLRLQPTVPCALVQLSPQVRQFAVVPLVVSQPAALVQSRWVESQVTTQLPVEQVAVAFAGLVHGTPQSPQLVAELTWVSQPLLTLPSQLL